MKTEEPGTAEGNIGFFGEPAPHPNKGARTEYLAMNQPKGAIGLVIRSVNLMGGIINDDLNVLLPNEAPMPIHSTPYQCLAKMAIAGATRRRMIASATKE